MPADRPAPLSPRHWPSWAGVGLFWLLVRVLPYAWLMALGAGLGRLFGALAKRRQHIVSVNLRLCFPELSEAERARLRSDHFAALGMGIMETGLAWWGRDRQLATRGRIEGLEHLHAALAQGRGAILFTGHFTPVELGTRYLGEAMSGDATYRPNENPVLDYLMRKNRRRYGQNILPRDAVREMLRSLKANRPLWFAPDQNFGHKGSVFADFFGVSAATNTATRRLAQLSRAPVVPFFVRRQAGQYVVQILPALADFPGPSDQADAERLNRLLEDAIRQAPEQYLWAHRRFKDRPPGQPPVYR